MVRACSLSVAFPALTASSFSHRWHHRENVVHRQRVKVDESSGERLCLGENQQGFFDDSIAILHLAAHPDALVRGRTDEPDRLYPRTDDAGLEAGAKASVCRLR